MKVKEYTRQTHGYVIVLRKYLTSKKILHELILFSVIPARPESFLSFQTDSRRAPLAGRTELGDFDVAVPDRHTSKHRVEKRNLLSVLLR